MAWIGKVAGGLLGYAAGRLPGAVLGVILGHQFDRGMVGRPRPVGTAADRQRVFFETTFIVMGHLAKVDGRVSEEEIGAARGVMRRLRLDEGQRAQAIRLFNTGKEPGYPVDGQVARLREYCGSEPQLLQLFLEIQIDMALATGDITAPERQLLGRIAAGLGVSALVLSRIEALLRARRGGAGAAGRPGPGPGDIGKAYQVLGVTPAASDREVKTAYRRLMNQHHPDKQAARGLPEAMRGIAEERTREIRAAYEAVRDHRGFR